MVFSLDPVHLNFVARASSVALGENLTEGGTFLHAQKSVSSFVGRATRTAFNTAAKSITSCVTAPAIGGR